MGSKNTSKQNSKRYRKVLKQLQSSSQENGALKAQIQEKDHEITKCQQEKNELDEQLKYRETDKKKPEFDGFRNNDVKVVQKALDGQEIRADKLETQLERANEGKTPVTTGKERRSRSLIDVTRI